MPNYLALIGNIENDPEIQYCGDQHDQPEASFVLAFQTKNCRTGSIKVTCYNRLAQFVSRYLHQGSTVAVSGVLDQQQGQTADEQGRNRFRLIARSLELFESDCLGNTAGPPLRSCLSGHQLAGAKLQDDLSKGSD